MGPDGSLHLLAITEEPLAIDGAPVDVASESATFLVKLGSSGAVEHVLPTTHLHHLSVDSAGNTFLSGAPKGSVPLDLGGGELNGGGRIVIGKLGPDAQHLWSRSWGGETFSGAGDVSADPAGDVVLIGTLEGSVDFGDQVLTAHPDAHDLFVAKLNGATGATVWSRAFGGDAADLWARVAVGDDGAIHLAGEYSGTPLFVEPALPPPPSFEHRSLFVARLDPDGAPLWSRPILCSAYCSPMGVTAGGAGTTIMTLAFKGPVVVGDATFVPIETDALVVAFDAEGQVSWVKQQSGPGDQWAFAPVVNGQGDILVPFRFSPGLELGAGPLTSGEGSDLAIARFTPAGLLAWSHQLGATGPADQPILAVTPYDEVVLALSFCGDVDTGAGTLQASCAPSSDGDIAITKLGK